LAGVSSHPLKDIKVNYYTLLLQLLRIGIPYEVIQEMSREEILYLLTVNLVQEERQQQKHG